MGILFSPPIGSYSSLKVLSAGGQCPLFTQLNFNARLDDGEDFSKELEIWTNLPLTGSQGGFNPSIRSQWDGEVWSSVKFQMDPGTRGEAAESQDNSTAVAFTLDLPSSTTTNIEERQRSAKSSTIFTPTHHASVTLLPPPHGNGPYQFEFTFRLAGEGEGVEWLGFPGSNGRIEIVLEKNADENVDSNMKRLLQEGGWEGLSFVFNENGQAVPAVGLSIAFIVFYTFSKVSDGYNSSSTSQHLSCYKFFDSHAIPASEFDDGAILLIRSPAPEGCDEQLVFIKRATGGVWSVGKARADGWILKLFEKETGFEGGQWFFSATRSQRDSIILYQPGASPSIILSETDVRHINTNTTLATFINSADSFPFNTVLFSTTSQAFAYSTATKISFTAVNIPSDRPFVFQFRKLALNFIDNKTAFSILSSPKIVESPAGGVVARLLPHNRGDVFDAETTSMKDPIQPLNTTVHVQNLGDENEEGPFSPQQTPEKRKSPATSLPLPISESYRAEDSVWPNAPPPSETVVVYEASHEQHNGGVREEQEDDDKEARAENIGCLRGLYRVVLKILGMVALASTVDNNTSVPENVDEPTERTPLIPPRQQTPITLSYADTETAVDDPLTPTSLTTDSTHDSPLSPFTARLSGGREPTSPEVVTSPDSSVASPQYGLLGSPTAKRRGNDNKFTVLPIDSSHLTRRRPPAFADLRSLRGGPVPKEEFTVAVFAVGDKEREADSGLLGAAIERCGLKTSDGDWKEIQIQSVGDVMLHGWIGKVSYS